MSFWKWLIPAAAAAAIPFTGGLSAFGLGAGGAAGAAGAAGAVHAGLGLADLLTLGGMGAQVGASVYGAKKQTSAANHAADLQYKSTQDALAFERERQAQQQQQWNAYQQLRAPYRQFSQDILNAKARSMGGGSLGDLARY